MKYDCQVIPVCPVVRMIGKEKTCHLCHKEMKTTAVYTDSILGCEYDVHPECLNDREAIQKFERATAAYLYGDD
jgi:hypothetical protein